MSHRPVAWLARPDGPWNSPTRCFRCCLQRGSASTFDRGPMNIRPVIVAFLVLASSTRSPLVARQLTAAPVSIPFELENHLVIINARVNNSEPLAFIFDTGASAAIVRTETARSLGLSLQGTVNGRG